MSLVPAQSPASLFGADSRGACSSPDRASRVKAHWISEGQAPLRNGVRYLRHKEMRGFAYLSISFSHLVMTDSDITASDSKEELIELGRTAGAYGFKGWVRIQPEGTGEVLSKVRDWVLVDRFGAKTPVRVKGLRAHGTGLIAKWDGCESKEAADAIRVRVGVLRKDFPEAGSDAVWAVDLEGLAALNRDGVELGRITGVTSNGAQDLFVIDYLDDAGEKKRFFIPNVKDVYVLELNTAEKRAVFDWDPSWR